MRILRARLLPAAQDDADAEASDARSSRSARSTAPSGSAPTTSRRTASPTTAPATRPTTSTPSSTASSSRSSSRASRPTWRPGSRPWRAECARARPPPGPPSGCGRRGRLARARRGRAAGARARPRAGTLPLVDERRSRRQAERYDALLARRAAREPLQHLTGSAAFRHVELAVGPGVFVPRPETELLAGWAIEQRARRPATGAAGRRRPLHRLRRDRQGGRRRGPRTPRCTPSSSTRRAHGWAERNLAGTGVDLRQGDMATAFDDLRRHRRRRRLQSAVHPARGLGVGRRRGARPRPAPRALLRRGRARRDPRAGAARGAAPPARGSGRGRARRRPGRVRAGACSPPPAAGSTSSTTATWRVVRASRPRGWHDERGAHACDLDRRRAGGRGDRRGRRVRRGELVVIPTDTVYGIAADAFSPDAVQCLLEAKGRGREMPPPVLVRAATTLDALAEGVPGLGPHAGRGVLARPADARLPPAVLAAVGPGRDARHRRRTDARRRGRPRGPRAHRSAGRELGQPDRAARRHQRRRGRGDAGGGRRGHRRRAAPRPAAEASTIVDFTAPRAACCVRARCPSTSSTPRSSELGVVLTDEG